MYTPVVTSNFVTWAKVLIESSFISGCLNITTLESDTGVLSKGLKKYLLGGGLRSGIIRANLLGSTRISPMQNNSFEIKLYNDCLLKVSFRQPRESDLHALKVH